MEESGSSLVVISLAESHRDCRRDDYRYDLRLHHWLYHGSDGLFDFDHPTCDSTAVLCDWLGDFRRADEDDSWEGFWRVPLGALGQADVSSQHRHAAASDTVTAPNQITGANAGGPRQLPMRTRRAACVTQFWR